MSFCAFLGLLSLGLVLSIQFPAIGNGWYALSLAGPLAGVYYVRNAKKEELVQVKMVTADDDSVTDVLVEGDSEEIERFRATLKLMEKGKIYVKGLLEKE